MANVYIESDHTLMVLVRLLRNRGTRRSSSSDDSAASTRRVDLRATRRACLRKEAGGLRCWGMREEGRSSPDAYPGVAGVFSNRLGWAGLCVGALVLVLWA